MISSPHDADRVDTSLPETGAIDAGSSVRPIFRRTWLALAVAGLLSGGVGVGAMLLLAKERFVYSGTLLFNESYLGSPVYRAPDVFSMATLMKTPQTLNQLKEEFGLAVPLMLLERRIAVDARHGSATVGVQFEWESREDAEKMLNRLMEITVDRSRDFRDQRVQRYVTMFNDDFQQSEHRFGQVRNEMLTFYRDEHTLDLNDQMRTLSSGLKTLSNDLAFAVAKRSGTRKSLARVREMMATENEVVDPSAEANAKQDESAKNFARAQLNKARLEGQIKEYQDQASTNVLLTAKRRDLERARQLFSRRFITATELEQLESEVQLLEIQLREDAQLKQWKSQLDAITHDLESSAGTSMALAGVASNNLMLRAAELEGALEIDEEVVARLTKDLEERRQDLARLGQLRPKGLQLSESLQDAERQRDDLGRQLTDFNLLERSDASIFMVMEKAAPAIIPVLSNKKKILAAATGASFVGLASPILLLDFLRQRRRGQRTLGIRPPLNMATFADTGLPVYSGRSMSAIHSMSQAIMAATDRKGYAVLFTSVTRSPVPHDTLLRCAQEIAANGEPVLVVDPGVDPSGSQGFLRLLTDDRPGTANPNESNPSELGANPDLQALRRVHREVRATSIARVHALALGGNGMTWEQFAEDIPLLAHDYAVLLIAGPSTKRHGELARLMEDCDAILLTTEVSSLNRKGWKLLEQCRDTGKQVLGVSLRRNVSSAKAATTTG